LSSYAEILITPRELKMHRIINKKIVVQRKKTILIEGTILDKKSNPIDGVIIVIKKIDYNYKPYKVVDVGYAISNKYGAYAIVLEKIYNINYKIKIYEPQINLLNQKWLLDVEGILKWKIIIINRTLKK